MGVYWAKPTLEVIAAQRAMLERGEEKRKAARQAEERERLRDTFAAAALTGLLSNVQRYQNGPLTEQAFEIAEFMLKEREKTSVGVAEMDSVADRKSVATPRACASSCSQPFDSAPTTHDAVPEAKAESDEARTDKAATSHRRDGTGDTPSKAEIDALEFVVEEGRTASVDDYGILRSWLIRLRPEWESQSYEESDDKRANTTMDRDTTPSEGSVHGEGAVGQRLVERVRITQSLLDDNEKLRAENASLREAIRRLADQDATLSVQGGNVTVTMDATLTEAEHDALEFVVETGRVAMHDADTLRKLLERLK